MSEHSKHPCVLCDGFVQAGEDESKWGINWHNRDWVHFSCIENIFDATRRIQNEPEYAALKQDNAGLEQECGEWADKVIALKRENERLNKAVQHALRIIGNSGKDSLVDEVEALLEASHE